MAEQQLVEPQTALLDLEIEEMVLEALRNDHLVRESRVPLQVSVEDGVVTISGHVLSETMRERVLFAAATTPGVRKVYDDTFSDPEIRVAIARAIAEDEGLQGANIEINSYVGNVKLFGTVLNAEQQSRAVWLAEQTPGVRQVLARLTVSEAG